MANEVKQEVNVQAEVSGQQDVEKLAASFRDLQKEIDTLKNSSDLSNLSVSIEDATKHLKELKDGLISLSDKGILDDDSFIASAESLNKLQSELNIVASVQSRVTENAAKYKEMMDAIASGQGFQFLQSLSSDLNKTNTELETSSDWLERITKYVDDMPDNSKDNFGLISDEYIDELVAAGEAIPVLAENEEKLSENSDEASKQSLNLSGILSQLTKQTGLTNSSVDGLLKTLGASAGEMAVAGAAIAGVLALFKETYKVTEQVLGITKELGINVGKFVGDLAIGSVDSFIDSLELLGDAFENISEFCSDAIDKLQEFSDIGSDIQSAYFRIYQYLGDAAGQDIINYTDNISTLFNLDGTALLQNMKGILAVTSQLGLDTDGVVKYSKALQQLSLDLSAFSGETVESIGQQFENAINLGVLNSRSAIAKAFDLTDADIKQFKELNTELERTNFLLSKGAGIQGTYSRYMDTAAGKVMQLKNAYSNLMNTVGKLALALYATVAPVLIRIINLINWALNGLAKFLKIDLSSPVSNNAIGQVGKYADNIGKIGENIEEAGKQAEKASKKVASFDDVIQISEDKNSSGSGASSGFGDVLDDIGSMDPASILGGLGDAAEDDIFSIDKLKAKLKELLNDFKGWEEGIDWDYWRIKAAELGKTLAELANIIVDDEDAWRDLGDLIGNSINVSLEFLNTFAKEFHSEQFGKDIAVAFKEMFGQLDEDLAAETLYNWLVGVLSTGIGFFKERPLTSAADSISTIIAEFFNNLSSLDATIKIDEFLDNLFGDVLGAINTSLDNFENNNTGNRFASVIRNIFVNIGEHTPEIIETVSRYLQFLLNTLGATISQSIDGFFDGLGENPETLQRIINSVIGIFDAVFNNLGNIGEALEEHKDTIIGLIKGFVNSLLENADTWGIELQPLVDSIVEIIREIPTGKIGEAIRTFLTNAHIGDIISAVIGLQIRVWWQTFITKAYIALTTFGENVAGGLQAIGTIIFMALQVPIALIIGLIANLITYLSDFSGKVQEGSEMMWSALEQDWVEKINKLKEQWDAFWNGIGTKWEVAKQAFAAAKTTISATLTSIWDSIKQIFNGIKNTINTVIESIKKIVKDGINFIIDKLNALSFDIPDWLKDVPLAGNLAGKHFGFNIPRLAIGGIVDKPTTAVIGEDGTEAVIPLQKNTEWMDVLASKLANQINNNSSNNTSGNNVNIQLSNKNFYTRSEMLDFAEQVVAALRVYGINVSVAY